MPVPSETASVNASTRQSTPTSAPSSPTRGRPAVLTEQRADAEPAEDQAEHAADDRQHDAFGQQLADDPAARAADRRADRDLAPAAGRAHEQEVRDVGAGDEQHEADGADQHEQRRADVPDERLPDRLRR